MTLVASHRTDTRVYLRDGRDTYADTGRPVDERLGTHALLWIVDDPDAWAAAIEQEGDAEPEKWPRASRYIGEQRRQERYASAQKIRDTGTRRNVYTVFHDRAGADACATDLRHSHPNPGVRYLVVSIDQVDACPIAHCRQPRIHADGTWWHATSGYPIDCAPPTSEPEPEAEPESGDFMIDAGTGSMRCGWCEQTEHWAQAALGYWRLTGFHLLGVKKETNILVVLVEATTLAGDTVNLPHHCLAIPEEQHAKHAPHTVLARPDTATSNPSSAGELS